MAPKLNYLLRALNADGTPAIAIICTGPVYTRRNGTQYTVSRGRRLDLVPVTPAGIGGPWPYAHEVTIKP